MVSVEPNRGRRSVAAQVPLERVRTANCRAVYRALVERGDRTRAELAQATGLSIPTVASILGQLTELGIVIDGGTESGTGGRPAQRVRFVSEARLVLAVDLSGRRARACLVDLRGQVVASFDGPALAPGVTPSLLEWLVPMVGPQRPAVSRVALAVPGVVDPIDGHVDFAPALGWHDRAVAEAFETALGVHVVLENDVNALALAELHYGVGAQHRHVLYVAIGSGVGAGLVIDGQLYRGAHAAAGELGYSLPLLTDDTAPARAGDPGPFERTLLRIAEGCLDDDGRLDLGRPGAPVAFAHVVDALRPVLHNLACALDPELMVVAWAADPAGHLAARLRAGWRGPWPLPIAAGSLGPEAAARGVARLALDRLEEDLCRQRSAVDRDEPERARTSHGDADEPNERDRVAASHTGQAPDRRAPHA
jgi:predicted NBD/HSP70 family sugar kinase